MLVPSMNLDEIAAQVKREYDKIYVTTLMRIGAEYDRERKKHGICKEKLYPKEYEFKTAEKNNWIIFMHKTPGVKKYNGTENISFLCVVYYYSKKGLMAYYQSEFNVLAGFTSHFFRRYNERLALNLSKPIDIVKAFFRKGMYSHVKFVERNNKPHIIGFGVDGIRLGEVKCEPKYSYVEWKTFVTRKIAYGFQKKMERELFKELVVEMQIAEEENLDREILLGLKSRIAVLPVVAKIKNSKPAPAMLAELKNFSMVTENQGGFSPRLIPTDRIIPERLFGYSSR
ncbi:MAG: hypothetical protein ABI136_00845 [Ginsengibacter sp.]